MMPNGEIAKPPWRINRIHPAKLSSEGVCPPLDTKDAVHVTFVRRASAGAVAASDITITCTTATHPIVTPDMVPAGCFIAAVGAYNPDKQELDPGLFANARIIVDNPDQCTQGGDLAHAIRANIVTPGDVAVTLADLAAGAGPGRTCEDEIVIFDSTGTGVQDVAAAAAAYEAVRRAS